MFIDEATIFCRAGDGAKGCHSFFRDKTISKGPPDGGNGGRGGDIVLACDNNVQTLIHFQYNKHFHAKNGYLGSSNNKTGRDGESIVLRVPQGTIVRDQRQKILLRDLTDVGQKICVCRGGLGGRGNSRHKDATPGEPGEVRTLNLELKLIAEVGLIGFPNAGKSTFIRRISSAKPKVGAYPFTTTAPILGLARYGGANISVADIPGLIEGAHSGRGLGDRFLRHIERTKLLIHLVDASEASEPEMMKRYDILLGELRKYSIDLGAKRMIVAASKTDLDESEKNYRKFAENLDCDVYPFSSVTGEGIEDILRVAVHNISEIRKDEKE